MDRLKLTTLAHADHEFCNPLDTRKVDRVLLLLDLAPGDRVLDVGCGKGEMLVRLCERFHVKGVGIDTCSEFLSEARRRIAARAASADLRLHEISAADFEIEPGSFDAALCIGSTHAYGTYRATLRALAQAVAPGGRLLIGEGYWKQDPDPEYLAALGAERAEFTDHAGNVRMGVEEGLIPHYACASSEDEWDHYEGLYLRAVERYAMRHPEDPDVEDLRRHIRSWRDTYLRWGRSTLGFGLYLFQTVV